MSKSSAIARLSRAEKALICRKLHERLTERCALPPSEPALDAYLPVLLATAERLEEHLSGKVNAKASHAASAVLSEVADGNVDHLLRLIEAFLDIGARHRHNAYAVFARGLHQATFSQGLEFLDDRIPDENKRAADILSTLRSPEHASTIATLKLPVAWLDELDDAIKTSDQAYQDRNEAVAERGEHVMLGKDAETEWLDVVTRYRKYVESRGAANDVQMAAEKERLLKPLMEAIAYKNAQAATRATRRGTETTQKTEPGPTALPQTPTLSGSSSAPEGSDMHPSSA